MQVKVKLNNLRIAPRKVRLSADLIRGLEFHEAVNQLGATVKGANEYMIKLMNSALANAENNFGLDKNNLKVATVIVNEGPVMKRWMPRAFGRASMILKRTSKIELILEEIEEGKNRKTKEQMEKERKARMEAKKKEEKLTREQEKKEDKDEKEIASQAKDKDVEPGKEAKKLKSQKSGWSGKIFRRKSM